MANTFSNEETIALLSQRAKAEGDNFWIKVFRRRNIGAVPEGVATFSDAQVIHAANPETWLPRIAGGGPNFMLAVYHANDPTVAIGGMLQFVVPVDSNPPKEIDVDLVKSAQWQGPKSLVYPTKDDRKPPQGYAIGASASPAPTLGTAPLTTAPGVGQPGAFAHPPANAQDTAAVLRLENERARLEAERARVEQAAREIADQKRQMELDALKRENEARMRELESRLVSANSRPPEPKTDPMQTVAAIGAVLAPIVTQMLQGQSEMRLAMMKQQEQAMQLQQQIQAQAAERQQQMMQLIMTRPTVDPAVMAIIEKSRGNDMPTSQILHHMADAMGAMTQTTMDLVQTAADLNIGGGRSDDHPAMKAIKEGVKAMNSIFQGYQQAIPRPKAPRAAPAPQPPGFEQAALGQPIAHVNGAPAQVPAPTTGPQFADAPQSMNALDRLHALVMAQAPAADVARLFINALDPAYAKNDPSLVNALNEHDGEPPKLLVARVGMEWALAHQEYLTALHNELDKQGREAGLLEEEEEEDEEEDSSGDDEDEAEEATYSASDSDDDD